MEAARRSLTRRDCPFVIEQNNATGGVSYWQRNDNQSVADKNGISLADYIHAMYGFLRQAKAQRVLMIGCGGGTGRPGGGATGLPMGIALGGRSARGGGPTAMACTEKASFSS